MMIILDLDYTLFDAAAFKRDIAGAFGVQESVFNSTLQKYFKDKGIHFNPYTHLELLVKNGFVHEEKELEAVDNLKKLLARADRYLLDGAEQALRDLKQNGFQLVLLTHGDKHWQGSKIGGLGISGYFSRITIAEGDKVDEMDFLDDLGAGEEVVFINDDPEELYHMSRQYPKAKTYLVKGPYSEKVKDKKLYKIKQIPEILCR